MYWSLSSLETYLTGNFDGSVSVLLTTTEAAVVELPDGRSGRPARRIPQMDDMDLWKKGVSSKHRYMT